MCLVYSNLNHFFRLFIHYSVLILLVCFDPHTQKGWALHVVNLTLILNICWELSDQLSYATTLSTKHSTHKFKTKKEWLNNRERVIRELPFFLFFLYQTEINRQNERKIYWNVDEWWTMFLFEKDKKKI